MLVNLTKETKDKIFAAAERLAQAAIDRSWLGSQPVETHGETEREYNMAQIEFRKLIDGSMNVESLTEETPATATKFEQLINTPNCEFTATTLRLPESLYQEATAVAANASIDEQSLFLALVEDGIKVNKHFWNMKLNIKPNNGG